MAEGSGVPDGGPRVTRPLLQPPTHATKSQGQSVKWADPSQLSGSWAAGVALTHPLARLVEWSCISCLPAYLLTHEEAVMPVHGVQNQLPYCPDNPGLHLLSLLLVQIQEVLLGLRVHPEMNSNCLLIQCRAGYSAGLPVPMQYWIGLPSADNYPTPYFLV